MTDANLRQLREIGLLHGVVLERYANMPNSLDRVPPRSAAEVRSFDVTGGVNFTDAGLKEIAGSRILLPCTCPTRASATPD